jgi:preprotein translocase subunit SecG
MAQIIQTPLTVLHVIACLFLMLVVLVQPGKSGGLGAFTGAAAQQVFGGRGAGNFLTKTTWITATVFFLSSISLAYLSSSTDESLEKKAKATAQTAKPVPVKPPEPPKPVPVQTPPPAPAESVAPEPEPAPPPSAAAPKPKPAKKAAPKPAPASPSPPSEPAPEPVAPQNP